MKQKKYFLLILFSVAITLQLWAQKSLLQSGPMVGYSEMKEVLLWVQTKSPAKVQFTYWVKNQPGKKFLTAAKQTKTKTACTAKLIADQVQPGTVYAYQLQINDQAVPLDYPTTFQTQTLWQWRTDPPDFRVALGSCNYVNEVAFDRPGKPYGGEYQIFQAIHQKRPDLMLWLGDNIYFREVDWYSWTGILHRNTDTRSLPELQPLLASTHHYAIWDDHDYGPNDSDRSFIHKEKTLKAFQLFWGNPSFGLPGQGGITSQFQWADVDFFLLDDRYFRSPDDRKTSDPTILGKTQLEWLIDAMVYSKASFKMVALGGQVLNTYPKYETYIHNHPKERAYLLERIEEEDLKNVIFLTGDRHHTELSKLVNAKGNSVYDFTVSPLTASSGPRNEVNKLRVEGTLVTQRNFGLLEFSGPKDKRMVKLRIFDNEGKELWSQEIVAE